MSSIPIEIEEDELPIEAWAYLYCPELQNKLGAFKRRLEWNYGMVSRNIPSRLVGERWGQEQ